MPDNALMIADRRPMVLSPEQSMPEGVVSHAVYVDNTRVDSYEPNGSIEKPYKVLQEALNAAQVFSGGTLGAEHYTQIHILAGSYDEEIIWPVNRPISLRGSQRDSIYVKSIDARPITSDGASFIGGLHIGQFLFEFYITMYDCAIDEATSNYSNVDFYNCKITNFNIGYYYNNTILRDCDITNIDVNVPTDGETWLYFRNCFIGNAPTLTIGLGGDCYIYLMNSIISYGELVIPAGARVNNWASVIKDGKSGAGIYTTYAGYPAA
jgi:hypothetical protein